VWEGERGRLRGGYKLSLRECGREREEEKEGW
jgi:hypothetical protein